MLHEKFHVERLMPSSRGIDHSECRYFVLDPLHDHAAYQALLAYVNAESVRVFDPDLAKDILDFLSEITEQKIAQYDAEEAEYERRKIERNGAKE